MHLREQTRAWARSRPSSTVYRAVIVAAAYRYNIRVQV